ncbi:MAG: hypothetical protein AUH13_21095 [Acidobacteria bacterium 13_2_20CM_58_27]|nr:MAG: hypothetical protein AUH13_21095 [Acidobacteria bacterium 13_2_20CM_58_27]
MIVMLTPARRTDSERPVAADSAIFSGPEAGGNLERGQPRRTKQAKQANIFWFFGEPVIFTCLCPIARDSRWLA